MRPWIRTLVPGRHRALRGSMVTRRSAAGSQCSRQVTQLLLLLSDGLRIEECVALLDGGEARWLTGNRSHALVDATLREALMRAWYDPCTPREREEMARVANRLEALETYIEARFPVERVESVERELLLHMGRGMEVLRWDEKNRQAPGLIMPTGDEEGAALVLE